MTYASASSIGQHTYRQNQNHIRHKQSRAGVGPVSNFVLLLMVSCLLGIFYLSQVSRTSSYSYQIDNLNRDRVELTERYSALKVESAQLRSSQDLAASQDRLGLVAPTDVTYVD